MRFKRCYDHEVSSSLQRALPSLTQVQLLYSAILHAWTSTSSGGIADFGCLLSKCCLKVLGSGICVWKRRWGWFQTDLVVTNKTTLTATPLSACVIIYLLFLEQMDHLCFSCLHLPAESAVHKKYIFDIVVKGLIMHNQHQLYGNSSRNAAFFCLILSIHK